MLLPTLYKADTAIFFGQNFSELVLWGSSRHCQAVPVAMAFVCVSACQPGIGQLCTHQLCFGETLLNSTHFQSMMFSSLPRMHTPQGPVQLPVVTGQTFPW